MTWEQVKVAIEPQEKPWAAAEPQETLQAVAQPPEVKVSGMAKPPPWVAELPQLEMAGLAQPPQDAPEQHEPPNLPDGRMLVGWQPPLPPTRWFHLFPGWPPLPPLLPPEAGMQAFVCLSWGRLLCLYSGCLTPGPQAGGRLSPGHLVT